MKLAKGERETARGARGKGMEKRKEGKREKGKEKMRFGAFDFWRISSPTGEFSGRIRLE